jgi:putative flippase GtrA
MNDTASSKPSSGFSRYARAVRFAVVGLAATFAYAILATVFHGAFPFPAAVSSGLAYAVCAVGSYLGHRYFTFSTVSQKPRGAQAFTLLSLTGHGLSVLVPAVLSDYLGFATMVSTVVTCTVIPLSSALLTARLVFGVPLVASKT